MRGYKLFVPEDSSASVKSSENKHALEYIERVLKAEICSADEIDL